MADLSRLRIDRDAPAPRRRWVWLVAVLALAGVVAVAWPRARRALEASRAPEVSVATVRPLATGGGTGPGGVPVLAASGYVIARRSTDVGVKAGGRIAWLGVEEGTTVGANQVIARLEHADLDAQLEAAHAGVAEADAQLAQAIATHEEDERHLARQRALRRDGITTEAELTAATAAAAASTARVRAVDASVASARARVRVVEEAIENTNVRAPFGGTVVRKRAEVGETVSPMGVAGQSAREAGAIATIADLSDLEVQTEVSETNIVKVRAAMEAEITLPAAPGVSYRGRVRQVFPAADRAKAIVEVRVTIVDPDAQVKPEMTANVTFQEPRATGAAASPAPAPVMVVPKRAVVDRDGRPHVWVVSGGRVALRAVTLGAERIDTIEVAAGIVAGETVVVGPPASLAAGMLVRSR